MNDRRKFMAALAVAPAVIAAPAIASLPATQNPEWLELLATERRLQDAFNIMVNVQEEADRNFYAACKAAEKDWQDRYDARRRLPAVPAVEGESEDALETRIQAAIEAWNAEGQSMREERDTIRERLRTETGIAEVEARWEAACDAHTASLHAIFSYPSRDPDIIAHKLRLMMDRYGDDDSDLKPLLASIVGEA